MVVVVEEVGIWRWWGRLVVCWSDGGSGDDGC